MLPMIWNERRFQHGHLEQMGCGIYRGKKIISNTNCIIQEGKNSHAALCSMAALCVATGAVPVWKWPTPTKPQTNVNGEACAELKTWSSHRVCTEVKAYLQSRQADSCRNHADKMTEYQREIERKTHTKGEPGGTRQAKQRERERENSRTELNSAPTAHPDAMNFQFASSVNSSVYSVPGCTLKKKKKIKYSSGKCACACVRMGLGSHE